METNQEFIITDPVDPFTLLKLFQLLEKIELGAQLDLIVEEGNLPARLEKMLAGDAISVSPIQFNTERKAVRVTLTKLKSIYHSGEGGDCCCS